jgi:Spy/CpxP family protein refolding chaperone
VIGFIIAAECALALIFLGIYRRFRHHSGRHGLYFLFRRLKTTPGQEQVIRTAFSRLREAGQSASRETLESRPVLAEMLRADSFDEAGAKTWFAARQKTFEDLKPNLIESLREVHSVLDPEQRAMLGNAIASKWFGMRHYRHGHSCERYC